MNITPAQRDPLPWNILLVDDDEDVIEVSRMVLEDIVFEGRPLHILTANTAQEARQIFSSEPNIALAFVDVVMETEHAGLDLVRFVRETLQNDRVRLILRTGNPGSAPQGDVVRYLEIDDYKEKTDLTADRLGTSVLTSLRSYRNLMAHIRMQEGLQAIIESRDPADEEVAAQTARLLGLCAAMAQRTFGPTRGNGLMLGTTHRGVYVLGGFGQWAHVGQESAVPEALMAAVQPGALAWGQGAMPAVLMAGGLLLCDRPHREHAFFLWLDGFDAQPQADHLKVMQLFLSHRAGALARTALQREVVAAQTEVLFRLCEAVESRSKETGAHIRRIARYTRALAERLGLPLQAQRTLEMAAPMHDIGKVAIPDAVLNKAGPLDAQEWALMKTHSEVGYRLLSHPDFPVMQAAAEVALSHHERWDGTGYPLGLAGEGIPLSGRIVALVDVFDALLSRRAYKAPWPLAQVVEELQRLRGLQFDPAVLDVFLGDIDHFHAIFLNHPDDVGPVATPRHEEGAGPSH